MYTLQSSLYAFAIAVCILCLWIVRGAKAKHLGFLCFFLILESLGFTFEWLMLHPSSPGKALWLGFFMATSLFVAPCLWLFAREITEHKSPALKNIPIPHIAVITLGLLMLVPLLQTAHWGTDYANSKSVISANHSLFIHVTMLACITIFLLQVPYYLTLCVRLLLKHTHHEKVLFTRSRSTALNAVRILILVVCTNWLVGLLKTLHCVFLGKGNGMEAYFVFFEVIFTLWALVILLKQTTVFSMDNLDLATIDNKDDVSHESADTAARYAKSSLDNVCRTRIIKKLNESLVNGEAFRDNRLGLRELCNLINENPHYVSQVISQDFQTNFYDLINSHRIEFAKSALQASPSKAIIDIALDAGYNSKSTFNAAFRRHTDMTPSDYRRVQLN